MAEYHKHTFTLLAYTNREYGSTLAQECGTLQTLVCAQWQEPPHPALEFPALKQRGGAMTKVTLP
jgi:hypothetical protein